MPELNVPACPTHGTPPRSLHTHNFAGIVQAAEAIIDTISGVGTLSYSRCPYGYSYNFEGVVRVLEDLNTTISGIQGGGGGTTSSGIAAGSGIYITQSGDIQIINATVVSSSGLSIGAGSGIYITQSGDTQIINATVVSASGLSIGAGSGIYLTQGGSVINVNYQEVYDEVVSGHFLGDGSVTVTYSGDFVLISGTDTQGGGGGGGASVTVSGEPGTGYSTGDLWFDTNEGRLFVYASGGTVSEPAWYQTNAEAIALKSEVPPSGTGENAPPRDGSIWFNTLMGSLFVYDATTSGWYETGPSRSFAYGAAAPAATSTEGAGWLDTTTNRLKVWNGSDWVDIDIDGGVY